MRLGCEQHAPSSDLLTRLDGALHLVAVITAAIPINPGLREALLSSMFGERVGKVMQRFSSQLPASFDSSPEQKQIDVCPKACAETLHLLHQNLGTMLLSTALHASQLETCLQHPLTLLLKKLTNLSNARQSHEQCSSRRLSLSETSMVSLFEARNTPQVDSISHDWRKHLLRNISRDAECRYDALVRIVEEVCRDLEFRCNEAERPLRDEQSRSQALTVQLETARREIAELGRLFQDRGFELNSLTIEKNELSDQVRLHQDDLRGLEATLDYIRQELDQNKADADNAVQSAIESARHQDLAYLATLTGKDQLFEEQSLKLATSDNSVKNLECEVDELKSEAVSNLKGMQAQRKVIEVLNAEITTLKDFAASQEAKIQQLQQAADHLISSRDSVVKKAQEDSQRHESIISDVKGELQAAKSKATGIQRKYNIDISAKEAKILHLKENLQSSNEKWRTELEQACESAALAEQCRTSTVNDLRSKVRRFRREREERAKEFAEVQELSNRLMAVMGVAKNQEANEDCGSADSCDWAESSCSLRSSIPEPLLSTLDPAQFSDSTTSNMSGPTPKRTKRSRSPGSNVVKPVVTTTPTIRNAGRRIRVPLADLGSGQTPQPVKTAQLLRHTYSYNHSEAHAEALIMIGAHVGSGDESFDTGDKPTSTDQQQLAALGAELRSGTVEGTTTEF